MTALSGDAKLLAGGHWGLPIARTSTLSYARPYAIWPRTRAALTELVNAGFLVEEADARGVHFRPSGAPGKDCAAFLPFARRELKHAKGLMISAMTEEQVRDQRGSAS